MDGIIQSVASQATIEKAKQALESELDNYSQSIVDDSIRRNAEFQTKAGLKTRVIRVYDGKGLHGGEDRCQFCLDRAGKWTYEEATRNGVFQRHRGCGCVISYISEKGNVSILSGTNTQKWEVREIKGDSSPKTLNGKTWKELEEAIMASRSKTGQLLTFDPEADFSIEIKNYSENINNALSEASRQVAELSVDGNEHLILVNLNTGGFDYEETGTQKACGNEDFWSFIMQKENKNNSYAYVHSHLREGGFLETDMRTLLGDNPVNVFCATQIDGKKYIAIQEGIPNTLNFDRLYEDYLRNLNTKTRNGMISMAERTREREQIIVDHLLNDYAKEIVIDGRR